MINITTEKKVILQDLKLYQSFMLADCPSFFKVQNFYGNGCIGCDFINTDTGEIGLVDYSSSIEVIPVKFESMTVNVSKI